MSDSNQDTRIEPGSGRSRIDELIRLLNVARALFSSLFLMVIAGTLLWIAIFGTKPQACAARVLFAEKLQTLPLPYRMELKGFVEALFDECKSTIGDDATFAALRVLTDPAAKKAFSLVFPPESTRLSSMTGFEEPDRPRDPPGPAEAGSETTPSQTPSGPGKATPDTRPTKTPTTAIDGWVAVGFVGDDTSFALPTGKTVETLSKDDTIVAKTQVNLRKSAADWTSPILVVSAGTPVKIVEAPKRLKAGKLEQIWARVRLE